MFAFCQRGRLVCALVAFLALGVAESVAAPLTFYSTTDPLGHWYVSFAQGADGSQAFQTESFQQAVAVTNRPDFIANNAQGSNGGIGNWTFFVFRQTFDLTGYDPTTAVLSFQWGADDMGQGHSMQGSWVPRFTLNGGTWQYGSGYYTYGDPVTVTEGFLSGSNVIDFFVEGNGQTDGFELRTLSFTAGQSGSAVPEPTTLGLLGLGLAGAFAARRRKSV